MILQNDERIEAEIALAALAHIPDGAGGVALHVGQIHFIVAAPDDDERAAMDLEAVSVRDRFVKQLVIVVVEIFPIVRVAHVKKFRPGPRAALRCVPLRRPGSRVVIERRDFQAAGQTHFVNDGDQRGDVGGIGVVFGISAAQVGADEIHAGSGQFLGPILPRCVRICLLRIVERKIHALLDRPVQIVGIIKSARHPQILRVHAHRKNQNRRHDENFRRDFFHLNAFSVSVLFW